MSPGSTRLFLKYLDENRSSSNDTKHSTNDAKILGQS